MTDENSSVLKELMGTLLFGIVVALLGVWWVEDKKMFMIGWFLNSLSIWRAMHMQSIEKF